MKKLILLFLLISCAVSANEKSPGVPSAITLNSLSVESELNSVPLQIHGAEGQSADLTRWSDASGNIVFRVQSNGRIYTTAGVKSDALKGGGSLILFKESGVSINLSITDNTGNFDYTGGAYANLFTDTVNAPFDGVSEKDWIVVRSGQYKGAMAEIDEIVNSANAILHTMHWDFDMSNIDYYVIEHPMAVIGDGYHNEFQVGETGHFDIHSQDWAGSSYTNKAVEAEVDFANDNLRAVFFEAECNGHNNIVCQEVHVHTGNLGPGKSVAGVFVNTDMSEAVSADSTTTVPNYIAGTTNGSDAISKAFLVLAGFDYALQVYGSSPFDPEYGYEVDSGTVTDRVNSGGAGNDAFINESVNVEIMSNDNDYILIGSDEKFEVVEVFLDAGSSRRVVLEAYYSKAGGNWTSLIGIDTTNQFRENGVIQITAPADWTKDDEAEVNGDITEAYYIKLVRTRNTIASPPIESHFKIVKNKAGTGMSITGTGLIQPTSCADSAGVTNSIYYSTDQSKLVYKDKAGAVQDLY